MTDDLHFDAASLEALDVLTDADREWFEAHPSRRYRLRPTELAEIPSGGTAFPGAKTVVMSLGSPRVRMRVPVGKPPPHLRQDTDRCCAEIIRRMDEAGITINNKPIGQATRGLAEGFAEILAKHEAGQVERASMEPLTAD